MSPVPHLRRLLRSVQSTTFSATAHFSMPPLKWRTAWPGPQDRTWASFIETAMPSLLIITEPTITLSTEPGRQRATSPS